MNNEFVNYAIGCLKAGRAVPLLVFIRPSKRCNAKCKMCSFWKKNNEQIPFSKMRKIIKNAAELGTKEIRLSGGEPLLYPYFFQTLKLIKDNGMDSSFITNGSLLSQKNVKKILALSPKQIHVSIDFPIPEEHDKERGFPGLWEKAVQGVKLLKNTPSQKKPKIILNFIVSNKNFLLLPSMLNIQNTVFDEINLIPIRGKPDWLLNEKQIKIFNNNIAPVLLQNAKKLGTKIRSENPFIFGTTKKQILASTKQNYNSCFYEKNSCFSSKFMLFIDSNGMVFPCSNMPYNKEFCLGNIHEDSLSEIWLESPPRKAIVLAGKSKTCKACEPTSIFFNSKINQEFD